MAKGCINGVLDETKYSSPVPLIGLYVAVASAVCTIFMLFDIISAFRRRKARWMPCRLFSLNSLTLTLLSICSKIPVDLTTPMPGVYDQLAKLTGTTLICVSMGFFSPSLADQSDSELFTNMVSLVVFVITVSVNICIQISTGVIYLFIKEHIIIMVFMCLSPFLLWYSTNNQNKRKEIYLDFNKDLMVKGKGSLLQRLKLCYIYGFNTNPQLRGSRAGEYVIFVTCCLISAGVLAQATVRSLIIKQLKFCRGNSDYDWSMQTILIIQILTILIGCFAIIFRWAYLWTELEVTRDDEKLKDAGLIIRDNPILGASSWDKFQTCLDDNILIDYSLGVVFILWYFLASFLLSCCCCCCWCTYCIFFKEKADERAILTEYKDLVNADGKPMEKWVVRKALSDVNRWMGVRSAENLSKLFSRTKPTLELCSKKSLNDSYPDENH